jgi:oligopeptide/dipeptide ABC transporter ATP-binding protein
MLRVNDLEVINKQDGLPVTLTGPISFEIKDGEIFGLVGESGSGKTMAALALMRLVPASAHISGRALLGSRDLVATSEREMRRIRGADVAMIFQEPVSALNPVFTLETQLKAAIRAHKKVSARRAREQAVELFRTVGIPDPETRLTYYPHQLSGGLCQRAMIAMTLASGAKFLIADEPTTALDVTIQEQIIQLIERLVEETGLSVLFIIHDLGVVARLCDRVAVLYAGEVVEVGASDILLRAPLHPYTQGLMRCAPDLSEIGVVRRGIPGTPPAAGAWPSGCRFRQRCEFARDACRAPQALEEFQPGHVVRCGRARELQDAR